MKKIRAIFLMLYFPEGCGGYTFRSKLLNILSKIENIELTCIYADSDLNNFNGSEDSICIANYNSKKGFSKIFCFALIEFRVIKFLLKNRSKYDLMIHMCGNNFTLPLIFSRLLGIKSVYILSGIDGIQCLSLYRQYFALSKNIVIRFFFPLIYAIDGELSIYLSNFLILETPNLYDTLRLKRYRGRKIYKNGSLYVDVMKFRIANKFNDRDNTIGYLGRLSPEKGILNFIRGILSIHPNRGLKTLIGGDGPLVGDVIDLIKYIGPDAKINYLGKMPNNCVNDFMNSIKLLVLPSDNLTRSEGLPNVLLEAMACGTPVLATSTGGVPDIIIDGETGFIMENNNPETIGKNIIRALGYPMIDKISEDSRSLIDHEFTFEAALKRWREIFDDIKISIDQHLNS